MKNIQDVLREKEANVDRLSREIKVLREAARILKEESQSTPTRMHVLERKPGNGEASGLEKERVLELPVLEAGRRQDARRNLSSFGLKGTDAPLPCVYGQIMAARSLCRRKPRHFPALPLKESQLRQVWRQANGITAMNHGSENRYPL